MTRFAVFGLGEAGSAISADLAAAGEVVRGFDPAPVATPPGVERAGRPAAAVEGAEVVLAVTAAADAHTALTQAIDAIPAGSIYADLATAAAGAKIELAGIAGRHQLSYVDVALMTTVPGRGVRTPALASGHRAGDFAAIMAPLGMPVTVAGAEPGAAATRKLLRSVVVKGLAGLVIESMRAARAAGMADETWHNLMAELTSIDEDFVRRLVSGSGAHARRRLHEMEATAELLADLGVDPLLTRATAENLRRIPTDGLPDLPAAAEGKAHEKS